MLQFQPKQVILVDDGLANRGIGNRIVHALLLTDRSTAGTHFRNQQGLQTLNILVDFFGVHLCIFLFIQKTQILHEFCSHIQVECNGRSIFICRTKVFACALNDQGPTFCIGRRHMALHMVFPEILLQKDHLSLVLEITFDLPDNNFFLVVTIQAAKETSVKIRYRHIMTPLRFIVDWNRLLPIHPPVISGIIVCGLDLKDCCGAIRQFHKVVHISQHPRILWVLEHLFDLVDPISGFPLEYLCYQRLQQMPHFHGNPVALIIFH